MKTYLVKHLNRIAQWRRRTAENAFTYFILSLEVNPHFLNGSRSFSRACERLSEPGGEKDSLINHGRW